MKQFRPLGKWVLVELDAKQEKSDGGIILVEHEAKPIRTATVIGVGKLCTEVAPKDRVILPQWCGEQTDTLNRRLIEEQHIMAVINDA